MSKALRSHVRLDISILESRAVPTCPKHPGNDLDMHCEPCNELICVKCSVLSHPGHSIISHSAQVMNLFDFLNCK